MQHEVRVGGEDHSAEFERERVRVFVGRELVPLARAVKHAIDAPVIAVGRIDPELGDRLIADDCANGLVGDIRGNEIFWRNGDRWSR